MTFRSVLIPFWMVTLAVIATACPAVADVKGDRGVIDLKKASVSGKYEGLQHVLNVASDKSAYGEFHDWGYWTSNTWAGYMDLKPGYWVYVYPNWYVWEKQTKE